MILLTAAAARPEIIDRMAAIVEGDVITTSEIDQMILLRIVARRPEESEETYRRRVLDWMIAQALRFRDVQRFGAEDVARDVIESRLEEIIGRFESREAFEEALVISEVTLDELRALIKRQLQVQASIEERSFIFVAVEEVERYYREIWLPQRRRRGLDAVPLSAVRTEIRALLKSERLEQEIERWTEELRGRANVEILAVQ